MQSYRSDRHRNLLKSRCFEIGCLLLALECSVSQARGQFVLGREGAGRPTVAGSVMFDGETQPAARVRVDVKAVTGGGIATTFTDSNGRFEATTTNIGSVIVAVDEQGYEPVEQRVDLGHEGNAPGVIITLRKAKPAASAVERAGYTVSVHDLKVPGKARHEFAKGMERLQKNDAEGSLGHFKEAADAFPNYYEAYYQIGVANLELRRGDEAEQALQRSIDLSGGGYAEPQFALGALLCIQRHRLLLALLCALPAELGGAGLSMRHVVACAERRRLRGATVCAGRAAVRPAVVHGGGARVAQSNRCGRQLLEGTSLSGPSVVWAKSFGGSREERARRSAAEAGRAVHVHLVGQYSYKAAGIHFGNKGSGRFFEHEAGRADERAGPSGALRGAKNCDAPGTCRHRSAVCVLMRKKSSSWP